MEKVRMNISHFRFILCNLSIFGEIVITKFFSTFLGSLQPLYWTEQS